MVSPALFSASNLAADGLAVNTSKLIRAADRSILGVWRRCCVSYASSAYVLFLALVLLSFLSNQEPVYIVNICSKFMTHDSCIILCT